MYKSLTVVGRRATAGTESFTSKWNEIELSFLFVVLMYFVSRFVSRATFRRQFSISADINFLEDVGTSHDS